MRHKFYVEDPKTKKPYIDVPLWKAWMSNTQPQRRLPTLLLYRGKDRGSFDRIAITNKSVTISVWRGKDSKETKEELMESALKWIQSMDAVVPPNLENFILTFLSVSFVKVPVCCIHSLAVVGCVVTTV